MSPYNVPRSGVLEAYGMTIVFDDNPEVAREIEELLKINPTDLSAEFIHQAADYGFLAVQQARAEYATSVAKAELERVYASMDSQVRMRYENNGKKYTEAVIKGEVVRSKAYIAANENYLELEYHAQLLKVMTNAMKQRADMLISLGAMTRQELAMTGMEIGGQISKDTKERIRAMKR